eukprot:jgi/Psemu1/18873/gm1.18873_g
MRDFIVIVPEVWDAITSLHADKYPGRDTDSIRNKYIRLYRKKMPTGDPIQKWDVKQAKEIKYLIGDRASIMSLSLLMTSRLILPFERRISIFHHFHFQQLNRLKERLKEWRTTTPHFYLVNQTQPTQIDEAATELTPTSTISGGDKAHEEKKVAEQERKVLFQVLIGQLASGGANTAGGKLKRKLEHLRLLCAAADSDESNLEE